ncbi:hypothetical protein Mapa_003636 [Marchantia paleacea]|nr:hypothetical protein Mapa_003636 [Marchantia paleacea]
MRRSDVRWSSIHLVAPIVVFCSVQLMQIWHVNAALLPEEVNALAIVRDRFNLSTWTGDPCDDPTWTVWITCSESDSTANTTRTVEELKLTKSNLNGEIPDAIAKLRNLRVLYLGQNKLTGTVPDLRNLTSLSVIDLSENNLTGPLLDTSRFTNLSLIMVSKNNFSGGIPRALFNHSSVVKIISNNNPLGGPVPDFKGLTSIKELFFYDTGVVGTLPSSMKNLVQTTHIEFFSNPNITGPLPDLSGLSSMQYWDSSSCALSGPLPDFRSARGLEKAALNSNNHSGTIPPALFQHDKIRWLNLYENPLVTGDLPDVSQLASVEVFSINDCNLTGRLPSFQNNTKLQFLNAWANRFTSLASDTDFANMSSIVAFDVRNNSITGRLPDFPPSSIQQKVENEYLRKIKLTNNSFFGGFPQSWFELNFTEQMLLGYNNLSGPLPKELGKLSDLKILEINNNFFSGPIPDEIGNLKGLEILDLRNNQLNGIVPESLASIPNLTQVLLDNNMFTGIPLVLISKLGSNITFANNTNIRIISNENSGLSTGGIVGVVIGAVVAGIVVLAILLCMYKKRHENGISAADMPKSAKAFTLKDIRCITSNNRTLIGKGGFGPVYYGKLVNGKEVAVKVRAADSNQGVMEFLNEVRLLSRLHHRNIVPLVGYCIEGRQQILVYDFMSQGTVSDHLYQGGSQTITWESASSDQSMTREVQPLSWKTRVDIAINAARGLEYLHKDCNPPVIHRDVKSCNILLGDKLQAKVTDLGISKQVPELATEDVETVNMSGISTAIKGTMGYLDPEYFIRRKLTTKSDVYSFGIVLLELITGKRPHSMELLAGEDTTLIDWVTIAVDTNEIETIVDSRLKGAYNEDGMRRVVLCALSCVATTGGERPEMGEIVDILTEALQLEERTFDSSDLKVVDDPYSDKVKAPGPPTDYDEEDHSIISYPTQSMKSF